MLAAGLGLSSRLTANVRTGWSTGSDSHSAKREHSQEQQGRPNSLSPCATPLLITQMGSVCSSSTCGREGSKGHRHPTTQHASAECRLQLLHLSQTATEGQRSV